MIWFSVFILFTYVYYTDGNEVYGIKSSLLLKKTDDLLNNTSSIHEA